LSLSKKITEDMAALAYKIIRRAGELDDEKVRKMVTEYNRLDELLKKAGHYEKIVKQEKKASEDIQEAIQEAEGQRKLES
jgi:Tex-like protein N-terminal domain.